MEILWKGTIFAEFWTIRPKLYGNCAFPQNFNARKLGEITVFSTVFKPTQNLGWMNLRCIANHYVRMHLVHFCVVFCIYFIYNFIFRWCLKIANANKSQQNTIKTLLIISSTRTVNIFQFFKFPFQFNDGFTMINRLEKTIPQ